MTKNPYMHPGQSPKKLAANARKMGKLRWKGVPPAERTAAMRELARKRAGLPQDPSQARCECGAMTLARATARAPNGKGLGHKPGCPFHTTKRRPGGRPAA